MARSPFTGEGHRKVHARLRILDGIRVARKRVLRIMGDHGLLSPHRVRQGAPKLHEGQIITLSPNLMWGTDGAAPRTPFESPKPNQRENVTITVGVRFCALCVTNALR